MTEEDCFLWSVKKAMLAFGLLALAMISGCLPMAAPMAIGVARAVVSGISSSARAGKNKQIAQDTKPCDIGERPLPSETRLGYASKSSSPIHNADDGRCFACYWQQRGLLLPIAVHHEARFVGCPRGATLSASPQGAPSPSPSWASDSGALPHRSVDVGVSRPPEPPPSSRC